MIQKIFENHSEGKADVGDIIDVTIDARVARDFGGDYGRPPSLYGGRGGYRVGLPRGHFDELAHHGRRYACGDGERHEHLRSRIHDRTRNRCQ